MFCVPEPKAVECELLTALEGFGAARNLGGSVRAVDAATTLGRILPKLDAFGISRIADITALDSIGIPVVLAIRPLAKSISMGQGKGLTLAAAKVSAIMESIEVWHGENLPDPNWHGHAAAARPPLRCMGASDLVGFNARRRGGDELDSGRWHTARDLMSLDDVLIPEAVLSLDTTLGGPSHLGATTNGLASGNSYVEALSHSAFELIERHAFSAWCTRTSADRACTSISLAALDPINAHLVERITGAGCTIKVFDMSEHALGLYAYVAEISEQHGRYMARPYTGRGLHVAPSVALTRAITESAQSRLSMISGARDDNFDEDYHLWCEPQRACGALPVPVLDSATKSAWLADPIEFIRRTLRSHGFGSWIAYDHARTGLDVPVVHGFIPGMQHVRI